jgi:signal transduction histidine kinase
MNRLLPKSLVGQMAVLIGIALLLAQLASFAYVLTQRHQFNRAEIDAPAIIRFTSTAADYVQAVPEFRALVLSDASRRGSHYELANKSGVGASLQRRDDTEDRLRQSLSSAGVSISEVRAAIDPRPPVRRPQDRSRRPFQAMLLSGRLSDGHWLNARLLVPGQPPLITPELAVGTLLLYVFVLLAAVLIALKLARPLRELTEAAEAFRGRNQPITVNPSGPADLRNAIIAFNAMNERVVKLLEEKDRTLGAIGHDLRTPLASLRIRAESVEPEEDRERMIATIEEMAATLEDILTLARSGRSGEQFEQTDVSKLARCIVHDYRELEQPVTFTGDGGRVLNIQPNLLRRAVRNLIDNALKYGGTAEVEVQGSPDDVTIAVLDRGPGIAAEDLQRISGAFYRAEPSRNRATGGAGLGLSIAEAVADAHGGKLTFANRHGGGLAATISVPRGR